MADFVVLSGEALSAKIALKGAELIDFSVNGESVLWRPDGVNWNRTAPNLFPIVGRLMYDELVWEGVRYPMGQHGFARDSQFVLVEQGTNFLVLELGSNEVSRVQYPFEFVFRVKYQLLEDRIKITYSTTNLGESLLPYSVGGHPGFALQGALDEHELWFDVQVNTQRWLIEDGYYNGKTLKLNCGKALELHNDFFVSDAIVLRSPEFSTATLVHKTKGKLVTVDCSSWDAVGFWTKPGAPFLCIEPWWGWADSLQNFGDFATKEALHWLEPNEEESLFYEVIIPPNRFV